MEADRVEKDIKKAYHDSIEVDQLFNLDYDMIMHSISDIKESNDSKKQFAISLLLIKCKSIISLLFPHVKKKILFCFLSPLLSISFLGPVKL